MEMALGPVDQNELDRKGSRMNSEGWGSYNLWDSQTQQAVISKAWISEIIGICCRGGYFA